MSDDPKDNPEDEATLVDIDELFASAPGGAADHEDPDAFLDDPATEALIAAHIDRAVAPYQRLLSAAAIVEMREQLRLVLMTDPVALDLLRRLKPRAALDDSDKVDVRGFNGARFPGAKRGAK